MKKRIIAISCLSIAILLILLSSEKFPNIALNQSIKENADTERVYADSSNFSFEHLVQASEDLKKTLIENGYQVADGSYKYSNLEGCKGAIEKFDTCRGANSDTTYGHFIVPRGPGEPDSSVNFYSSNESRVWRMRLDEAIVLLAINPPEARYFTYGLFLYSISTERLKELTGRNYTNPNDSFKDRFIVWSSYGTPLNDDVIKASNPADPYNSATVVVVTANKELGSKLRLLLNDKILPAYGIHRDIVNTLSIPADDFKLGYEKNSDEFRIINKVAHPKDMKRAQEYFNNPPAVLLRIWPPINATITKFEWQDLPQRRTGTNEDYLTGALNALAIAVRNKYQNDLRIGRNMAPIRRFVHPTINECLLEKDGCVGGNPDQIYTHSPAAILTKGKDDFIIAVGVNHVMAGKAKYMSVTVGNAKWEFSIGAIGDEKLNGTAEQYLAYIPKKHPGRDMLVNNVGKFYAYKISRACNNEANCFEVPENSIFCEDSNGNLEECENVEARIPGIDINDSLRIIERAYKDPKGAIGPSLKETLPPKFILFTQNEK